MMKSLGSQPSWQWSLSSRLLLLLLLADLRARWPLQNAELKFEEVEWRKRCKYRAEKTTSFSIAAGPLSHTHSMRCGGLAAWLNFLANVVRSWGTCNVCVFIPLPPGGHPHSTLSPSQSIALSYVLCSHNNAHMRFSRFFSWMWSFSSETSFLLSLAWLHIHFIIVDGLSGSCFLCNVFDVLINQKPPGSHITSCSVSLVQEINVICMLFKSSLKLGSLSDINIIIWQRFFKQNIVSLFTFLHKLLKILTLFFVRLENVFFYLFSTKF